MTSNLYFVSRGLHFKSLICFVLLIITHSKLFAQVTPDGSGIVYVKSTGSGNGSSWANATSDLQKAINAASVAQVWVAAGTYKPIYPASGDFSSPEVNNRDSAFLLKKDVKIYGGFSASSPEASTAARNLTANVSVLSGDLGSNDGSTGNTENAYHVVLAVGDMGTAVLDGFTISGGNASESASTSVNSTPIPQNSGGGMINYNNSLTMTNLIFSSNSAAAAGGGLVNFTSSPDMYNITIHGNSAPSGGGMVNHDDSSPMMTNIDIRANTATNGAGMVNDDDSDPIITNIVITGNKATAYGGAMVNQNGSDPIITNATISGNEAGTSGSGITNTNNSHPTIRNTVIYGHDTAGLLNDTADPASTSVVTYSLIQSSTATGNGNVDPTGIKAVDIFVERLGPGKAPTVLENYALKAGSPAAGKGNNAYFAVSGTPDLNGITKDLAGNNRIAGTNIDLGAYEDQTALPVKLVSFTAKVSPEGVAIQWQTTDEMQNKSFELQRSGDGINFVKIAEKNGQGDKIGETRYDVLDNAPQPGPNYYKLFQTDFDGTVTRLGIRVAYYNQGEKIITAYPIPSNETVTIDFTSGKYNLLELSGINGTPISSQNVSTSQNQANVSLNQIPAGVYIIKLTGPGGVETKKIVKRDD